jgi:hypothetical protein
VRRGNKTGETHYHLKGLFDILRLHLMIFKQWKL